MAKPLIHARNSVKRYGGSVDDYLEIHNFMDSTNKKCFIGRSLQYMKFYDIESCGQIQYQPTANTAARKFGVKI